MGLSPSPGMQNRPKLHVNSRYDIHPVTSYAIKIDLRCLPLHLSDATATVVPLPYLLKALSLPHTATMYWDLAHVVARIVFPSNVVP